MLSYRVSQAVGHGPLVGYSENLSGRQKNQQLSCVFAVHAKCAVSQSQVAKLLNSVHLSIRPEPTKFQFCIFTLFNVSAARRNKLLLTY